MNPLPAQPNQSLMEGIEVLLALVQRGDAVGVRELARELGMTPTRLQRYVATLAHLGLAERDADRRYGVGPGIHALSAMSLSASGLAQRAMEILPGLNDLGLSVALGVLWRKTVSYMYFSRPGMPTSRVIGKEQGFPARDSVIGVLLLAHASEEQVLRDFPTEAAGLRPRLAKARRDGFVRVERSRGEIALAVPVGSPPFAGLAVTGIIPPSAESAVIERLHAAASAVAPSRSTPHEPA